MTQQELYNEWAGRELDDKDLTEELEQIKDDPDAINDRFYRELEFGTGGIRGVLGAGTNRMNIYTVRKATQGMAKYLLDNFKNPSVAISRDSRNKSELFACEAARVFAANGIKAHIYKELMPTPCLSFAVRSLECSAGVMVTASHNPAKYNGYKAYGADGCQMTAEAADTVMANINSTDIFEGVKLTDYDQAVKDGLISVIDDSVIEEYYKNVTAQSINPDAIGKAGLKIVYTPLNGTGNKPVRRVLDIMGASDVTVVPEQEMPDGNFPTCPFPNPEISEALDLGLKLSRKIKADLLLATDPDSDRVGIAVPDENGEYVLISGNEVGALLLEYICSQRLEKGTMPEAPIAVKTIVSSDIITKICAKYGVELINVLTGFKYIGEQIGFLEKKGEENRYVFGFEESYGYLAGTYVRDKDAVVAGMLICEMASYYKLKGISVLSALENIYNTYGVYLHSQKSFVCEGASGMELMAKTMKTLRENRPESIGGLKVTVFCDYLLSKRLDIETGEISAIQLPKSDVLEYRLEEGASIILRPSGTEPKMKAYCTTTGKTKALAKEMEEKINADFARIIGF